MADAYSAVVGGKLNLKGIKKKKKRTGDELVDRAAVAAAAASNDTGASSSAPLPVTALDGVATAGHTAAELRRLQTMAKRDLEKLERGEKKSHRDRVKDFNSYLANLSEHYDLPKVSKGASHHATAAHTDRRLTAAAPSQGTNTVLPNCAVTPRASITTAAPRYSCMSRARQFTFYTLHELCLAFSGLCCISMWAQLRSSESRNGASRIRARVGTFERRHANYRTRNAESLATLVVHRNTTPDPTAVSGRGLPI
jgi:protein FAM32A